MEGLNSKLLEGERIWNAECWHLAHVGSQSGLEIHLEIQCLFRETLQIQTQVFCLFAQGLPLCQLPSDRTTKEYLRNLKSCLGELGVLSKKTQRHKEIRKVVFKSSKNYCQVILLPFAEPFQCAGYCAGGFIHIYIILFNLHSNPKRRVLVSVFDKGGTWGLD